MIEGEFSQGQDDYRPEVTAVVKWYNPTKGFGFVKPTDGEPDAFLHASLVTAAGHQELPQGSTMVCDITMGPKGPQVAAIHSVEPASPDAFAATRPPRRYPNAGMAGGGGAVVEGRVKFYNAEKGFGFIIPDDGGKDVFVSARTLTRAGLAPLQPEQRVRVSTRMGDKGPMAHRVELI